MAKCKLCGNERSLNNVLAKDNDGEDYVIAVCDTCWDAIAAISRRAVDVIIASMSADVSELSKMVESLKAVVKDTRTQMYVLQGMVHGRD